MEQVDERSSGDRLGQEDREVRAAIRFTVLAAAAGVGFLIMAASWVSTCPGTGVDTVACGAPERTMLALGAPLILLAAGCGHSCAPTACGVTRAPGGVGTAPAGSC